MPKKRKLMIVDGHEIDRAILNELFCRNFEILEAENEEQAVRQLDGLPEPDGAALIILSPEPYRTGASLIMERLAKTGEDGRTKIPLILIEDADNGVAVRELLQQGGWDVILKPLYPSVIRRRIFRILELEQFGTDEESERAGVEKIADAQSALMSRWTAKRQLSDLMIIDTLSTVLEFRFGNSGGHVQRIRLLTCLLLDEVRRRVPNCGLSEEDIQIIGLASMMHDVGKIAVPDRILEKPGALSTEEYELIKLHTTDGVRLLRNVGFFEQLEGNRYYYDVCRWHHERWDGSGYPDGLVGAEIPIWAQAVGLADCYDTLVNKRVYRPAFSHFEAIKMLLQGDCGSFNPLLLEILRDIQHQFYEISLENGLVLDDEPDSGYFYSGLPRSWGGAEAVSNLSIQRVERLLKQEQQKYQQLASLSSDITFLWDAESDLLRFSGEFLRVFGETSSYKNARRSIETTVLIVPEDRTRLVERLRRLPANAPELRMQLQMIWADGTPRWYELFTRFFWEEDLNGELRCVSAIGRLTCIDERKQETLAWKQEATYDSLTGLFRRGVLEEALQELTGKEERFAFLFMDVDHFKQINDQRGHLFGDWFLKTFADALRKNLRASDLIAREGGDEFAAILRGIPDASVAVRKAQQLAHAFKQIPDPDGEPGHFSGSIGIAIYPDDGKTPEELFERADKALYQCKNRADLEYVRYDAQTMGQ